MAASESGFCVSHKCHRMSTTTFKLCESEFKGGFRRAAQEHKICDALRLRVDLELMNFDS